MGDYCQPPLTVASSPPPHPHPHVLVVPFPAQGHMIPLLDLAHDLACRGIAVTVVVTPKNLPLLTPTLSRHRPPGAGPLRTLVLPFPTHPSIPMGIENVQELPPAYFFPMMHALGGLRDGIYQWAVSGGTADPITIDAIVSDFFVGWTSHLASDLGVPRIVFSPSGANTLAIVHYLWRTMPTRPPSQAHDRNYPVCFPGVPNSPTHPWYQISPNYTVYLARKGHPDAEFVRDGFVANMDSSWGYVFNSFEALEAPYIRYMEEDMGRGRDRCQRVWAVGPLGGKEEEEEAPGDRGGRSSVEKEEVIRWLDGCRDGSVVYVCFGSQVVLAPAQVASVAGALERSGARFVWVLKQQQQQQKQQKDANGPEGGQAPADVLVEFQRRMRGVGLVIRGWAPQVAILRHRAVGWFLSHCGWNSVLEAVAAGVTILAWPMGADQYLNARVLVDELGVAVRACQDPDAVPDQHALGRLIRDAAGAVDETTLGGTGGEVSVYSRARNKARQLSDLARQAVRPGGSSDRDLDGLVAELRNLRRSRDKA